MNTKYGLDWITDEEVDKLKPGKTITLLEVEDVDNPSEKRECIVTPPDDTAYSAAMRYMANSKDNTNDVIKMQQTLFGFSFVKADTKLEEQMKDDTKKVRYIISIGKAIGEAFPVPESKVKKTLRTA